MSTSLGEYLFRLDGWLVCGRSFARTREKRTGFFLWGGFLRVFMHVDEFAWGGTLANSFNIGLNGSKERKA